ncbi:MAG: adenylate/guanylate cyclase domain-containing protein, partial [Croceivirga sp.]
LLQQKNIASLNLEKSKAENDKQIQLKRTYLALGSVALVIALLAYFLYMDTRKKHKKLNVAYEHLDNANEKLKNAENKIKNLLKQQVSTPVANELLNAENKGESAGKMIEACILFLDIRGFTPMAQQMSANELIAFQNNAFGPMLDIVQNSNGVVNQLMGDGFMATFGIVDNGIDFCEQAYTAAKEILKNVTLRVEKKEIRPFEIGLGLHAGPVVVGNVGNQKRKQFSITGNPVIIASRLEQLNKLYDSSLILSDAVFQRLKSKIKFSEFKTDKVTVKGWSDELNIHILRG